MSAPPISLRVAATQFRAGDDPVATLACLDRLVGQAALLGAQLVVAPEAAMVGFGARVADWAEPLDGPYATGLREIAERRGVWLVAGMFEPAADGRAHNTVVATDGERLHPYRKRHLFDAWRSQESATIAPGTDPAPVISMAGVQVGLSTCFDLRFAEQFTDLGRRGAQLICVPTSWASGPGKIDQFTTLVKARAMDAQCHLVAADQSGTAQTQAGRAERHPLGVGHSMVADPVGRVLGELGPSDGVLTVDLDLGQVAAVRADLPILGRTSSA